MAGDVTPRRFPRAFAALRHRNYRLFFGGQVVSLTGTWLHTVAQGWLVLHLTDSPLLLGVVGSVGALPVLLFSLPAGVVADRFGKRNLLVLTQVASAVLVLILAALTHLRLVTAAHVMGIGFLLGTVNAFDAPIRQSFLVEMVGRRDLMNAIALNSVAFNGARVLGPALAGGIIALFGLAGAFLLNGLSFLPVVAGLILMRLDTTPRPQRSYVPATRSLGEGLAYIRSHPAVAALLLLTAAVAVLAIPYTVLMPIFARDILHVGAVGLGYLTSATGVGALAGAFTLSALGDSPAKGRFLLFGNLTFCTMLIIFSFSGSFAMDIVLLLVAGWGLIVAMALTNTLLQTLVPDHLRGRVMSAYTMVFMGMAPAGSLVAGSLADRFGAPAAVRIGALGCAAVTLVLSPRLARSAEAP